MKVGSSAMHVYGVDFSSAPSKRKPIVVVRCRIESDIFECEEVFELTSLRDFELFLKRNGTWIAGLDFPFGQSRRFIETIGWPNTWEDYVRHVGGMSRETFRRELIAYKANRSAGDKEHRRATDVRASSISPQKLYGVPVALMFYEGAPRLLASGVSVPHLFAGCTSRFAVEAYPGVVARNLIGRRSYKSDTRDKQSREHLDARIDLFRRLRESAPQRYGFEVEAPESLCEDPSGDRLDALICAVQAAWAWGRRSEGYGARADVDSLEGWIADPHLLCARAV